MTIPFETDRFIFRTPIPDDAEFYASLENNPQVKRFVGGSSGHTADYYHNNIMVSRRKNAVSTLTVIQRDSGTLIGRAGIFEPDKHDEVEVYCVLAEEHWGQGFGSDIVAILVRFSKQLFPGKCIIGKVHPNNTASICILAKLGFREAGVIQSDKFDNGFMKFAT